MESAAGTGAVAGSAAGHCCRAYNLELVPRSAVAAVADVVALDVAPAVPELAPRIAAPALADAPDDRRTSNLPCNLSR